MRKRLFAWVYARFERRLRRQTADLRASLLRDLEGRVLEIGCGTGANFAYYHGDAEIVATDYSEHMLRRARTEAESAPASIELRQADAGALPFEDASFDAVVTTLVLCSVPDQPQALSEIRRVLRPGGTVQIFEHVRSDRRWVAAMQRVANPAWGFIADGCHLDRDTASAVRAAGFEVGPADLPVSVDLPMKHVTLSARRPLES